MKFDVTVTVFPEKENNKDFIEKSLDRAIKEKGIKASEHKIFTQFVKKSIDARHGKVKFHLRYTVFVDEDSPSGKNGGLPEWKDLSGLVEIGSADGNSSENANGSVAKSGSAAESGSTAGNTKLKSVIVIGSGPAGLFGALRLLEHGIRPIIIEQGEETEKRTSDIKMISEKGKVDAYSNFCFGEGGAGTFSDGKLYTRSNKRGNIPEVLQIFAHFGADKKILTDAHPHIGTEKLPSVINNIKDFIRKCGGSFFFNSEAVDFIIEEKNGKKSITSVLIQNTKTKETSEIKGDAVLLATGHSSYNMYNLLAKKAPKSLEAKTFAMGVRVEHPRELIDSIQFHGNSEGLGAAEYHLTVQEDERGVYSFCMCPGGFVVPSSSNDDEIVVNGMSASGRNSKWSNAAIVVETRPEDIPERFVKEADAHGSKALAGLLYRKYVENLTRKHGEGQKAPSQRLTDFLKGRESTSLPENSYEPGLIPSRLDEWLPPHIKDRLKAAFPEFDKKMKGFVTSDAILIASETRTSTPVRMARDKETRECLEIENLYPAGEGSGYAGGIVSSAMDGENSASAIAKKLKD